MRINKNIVAAICVAAAAALLALCAQLSGCGRNAPCPPPAPVPLCAVTLRPCPELPGECRVLGQLADPAPARLLVHNGDGGDPRIIRREIPRGAWVMLEEGR